MRINGNGIGSKSGIKSGIKSGSAGSSGSKKSDSGQKVEGVNILHGPFVDKLNEASINFDKEGLQKTLEEIKELGEMLVRNPNMQRLEEYKAMVKQFLSEALEKLYKVETKKGLSRLGREQKVYTLVEKIDLELEGMIMMFVKEQTKPMAIIDSVNEIQGLLCSILA